MKKNHIYRLKELMHKAAASLSDDEALESIELFPLWATSTDYAIDVRVRYDGTLYKCLTAHTSQETWKPDVSPSLWVRVDDPSIEWPEWVQPIGSTDAYAKGAKVSHNGKHWISDVDANVWEPGIAMWTEAE